MAGAGPCQRPAALCTRDSRVPLIQALIPLELEAGNELLQQKVTTLAGARYQRGGGLPGYADWSQQPGSVYLADPKVAAMVPRMRDVRRDQEVPLTSYQRLPPLRILRPLPETFGLSAISLSRRSSVATGTSARTCRVTCQPGCSRCSSGS